MINQAELLPPTRAEQMWLDGLLLEARACAVRSGEEACSVLAGNTSWAKADHPSDHNFAAGILSANVDCIEVLSLDGVVLYVSDHSRCLPDLAQAPGRSWVERWPFEQRPAVQQALTLARSGGVGRLAGYRSPATARMTWWDVTISAIRDTSGTPTQLVAFSRDMTLAQVQGEASDLLKIELSHRIKNLFALVNGLITVAARPDPAVQSFAEALCDRFAALSRALDYVLPAHASAASPSATTLQGLVRALLGPYDNLVHHQQQVSIVGDDPPVGPKATPSLALCIHELATNAVKYGALSSSRGRVLITCRSKAEGVIELTWSERGGPQVAAKPERAGFGSKLLLRTISGALGGRVRRRWDRRGLTLHMLVPRATLAQ